MKKYIITVVCLMGMAQATSKKTITGPGKFSGETFTDLEVLGPITAKQLTATKVEGHGPATFTDKSSIGSAEIYGPLTAKDSTFTGWTQVSGSVTAENSIFDDITVKGPDVTVDLTDTKAKNITILIQQSGVTQEEPGMFSFFYSTEKPKGTRVLLKGKTVVETIRFRNGEGTVLKESTAKITGKVFGAKEEKELKKDKERKDETT